MNKLILVFAAGLLFLGSAAAFTCDFDYTIIDPAGEEQAVRPGKPFPVTTDNVYTLTFSYYENHRNCLVAPEETQFEIDGSPWTLNNKAQPLMLTSLPQWEAVSGREHAGELIFVPGEAGTWELDVLRICTKGGYAGTLVFAVD